MSAWRGWAGFARSISSSSAMNPTLLTMLMVSVPSLFLAYLSPLPINLFFMVTAVAPLSMALWQIKRFTLLDPYQLRNDKLTKKALELRLGARSATGSTEVVLPPPTVLIENPELKEVGQ